MPCWCVDPLVVLADDAVDNLVYEHTVSAKYFAGDAAAVLLAAAAAAAAAAQTFSPRRSPLPSHVLVSSERQHLYHNGYVPPQKVELVLQKAKESQRHATGGTLWWKKDNFPLWIGLCWA